MLLLKVSWPAPAPGASAGTWRQCPSQPGRTGRTDLPEWLTHNRFGIPARFRLMTMSMACFLLVIFVLVSAEMSLALLVPYGGRASSTSRRLPRRANDDPVALLPNRGVDQCRSSVFGPSSARESGRRRSTWLPSSEGDNDDGPRSSPPQSSGDEGPVSTLASEFRAAAREGFGTRARNVAESMAEGDVVVPICGNLERRSALAQRGLYAGVEYVIQEIEGGAVTLMPAYRLGTPIAAVMPLR